MKKILLNTSRGSFLIDTNVIIRVEASSNYSKVFFSDGKMLLTAKLLSWFEEQLEEESFTRLHRSHLINNRYLQLQKCSGKAVELLNGKTVPVSRRRKKEVLQKLAAACALLFFFSYPAIANPAAHY
ncbi:MAG: LytTR family transcriptional regulator [Chitinophagales bacterium]|nr:LytTR family transcriptional regulator [Chitinophagales bacterium]